MDTTRHQELNIILNPTKGVRFPVLEMPRRHAEAMAATSVFTTIPASLHLQIRPIINQTLDLRDLDLWDLDRDPRSSSQSALTTTLGATPRERMAEHSQAKIQQLLQQAVQSITALRNVLGSIISALNTPMSVIAATH